jgi:hypothetical protein
LKLNYPEKARNTKYNFTVMSNLWLFMLIIENWSELSESQCQEHQLNR